VCIVDYIQHARCGDPHQDERTRIGEASRRLADVASETGAIMVAVSQLTEPWSQMPTPVPMPVEQQIRASKNIRNDASAILLLHRPYLMGGGDEGLAVLQRMDRYGERRHSVLDMDLGRKTLRALDEDEIDRAALEALGVQSKALHPTHARTPEAGGWEVGR
jgi:hypothetical protein